jgi:AraC-like DNA-binding protein
MSDAPTFEVARLGSATRLSRVTCRLGRRDKPYPELHEPAVWTIALVRRGSFTYRAATSNRSFMLRPGWLILGRPDAEFECSHDHDGGDDCASLSVAEDVMRDVARATHVPLEGLLSSAPALPPLARVAALVERALARQSADLDEAGYWIAEAVLAHASGVPIAEVARHPSHAGRVQEAIDRIEASCREPLTLPDLADAAGFSPYHFLRVFRRVTGTTPHQYLVGARLRLAARLLLDTDQRVTDIAYDVGFQDLSNFVRTFRRAVGWSPGAYRRR